MVLVKKNGDKIKQKNLSKSLSQFDNCSSSHPLVKEVVEFL